MWTLFINRSGGSLKCYWDTDKNTVIFSSGVYFDRWENLKQGRDIKRTLHKEKHETYFLYWFKYNNVKFYRTAY